MRSLLLKTVLTKSLCNSFNKLLNLTAAFYSELLHTENEPEYLNFIINVHTAQRHRNKNPVAFISDMSASMIQYRGNWTGDWVTVSLLNVPIHSLE